MLYDLLLSLLHVMSYFVPHGILVTYMLLAIVFLPYAAMCVYVVYGLKD